MGLFKFCLIIGLIIPATLASAVEDYNPSGYFSPDVTNVTWGHGVNSESELQATLRNPSVQMIVVDVVKGIYTGPGNNPNFTIPIIATPPSNRSDLSLLSFLASMTLHNGRLNMTERKGIKVNFKEAQAFREGLFDLFLFYDDIINKFPAWINADILSGPANASSNFGMDGKDLIRYHKLQFPTGTLSLGWETRFEEGGCYSMEHFNEMSNLLKEANTTTHFTFPLRAQLALNSVENILVFLDHSGIEGLSPSVTLWEGETDPRVRPEELRDFVGKIGARRVFVDLPYSFDH